MGVRSMPERLCSEVLSLRLIAPSRSNVELGSNGRRGLVHGDCALHRFKINSFSLESEFKPEPPILSDQALNYAFIHKMAVRAHNLRDVS